MAYGMGKRVTSQTFDAAQTSTVLVNVPAKARLCLEGVVFSASADNTVNPSMSVSLGSTEAISHPGVPAGGGLVATNLGITMDQGDDLTFDCTDPQGSVSVSVIYGIE